MDILSYTLGKKAGGGTPPVLENKEVTITSNGETTITPSTGYDGISSVDVTTNVPQPSGKIIITQNGTDIDVSSYATADVSVPAGITPTGTINITSNGTTDVTTYANASVSVKYAPKYISFQNYTGSSLADEINNMDAKNMTSLKNLFNSCNSLQDVTISGWDTSNVTDMSSFITSSSSLKSITLNNFNTSKVTTMNSAFNSLYYLRTFQSNNISNWDTSKVTNMDSMFQNVATQTGNSYSIQLDLSGWTTGSLTSMQYAFGCGILTSLDIRNFTTTKLTNAYGLFQGAKRLTHIDMRSFDFTKSGLTTTNMFGSSASNGPANNCLIIVANDTQKSWLNTNFSRMTNVKTVAEYEGN